MANCFFIMPFRPGLNYMYLYVKRYIETKYEGAKCARGDSRLSTGLLIDKIKSDIQEADIIVADCSGNNPNVFYELGVAHALGKKVILITSDENKDIPSDIRAYDQVSYGFDDDEVFCKKLDQVLASELGDRYDQLYALAQTYLQSLNEARSSKLSIVTREQFKARVKAKESAAKTPPSTDNKALATYLLPLCIDEIIDLDLATEIRAWTDKNL